MPDNLPPPRFIDLGGHRLAYRRVGDGPSVVLLHGIPTHGYLWRHVVPLLAAAGFETITFDLMGYGASDKPADLDLGIAAQAQYLGEALDVLGWRGGALAGHDIGGGVAQLFALARPERVRRLVLIDSIAYDSFPEPGIARLKEPVWDGILGDPGFDLAKGLAKGLTRGVVRTERVTAELVAAYEAPFAGVAGRLAYLRAARALRTEELASQMDRIEHLTMPTLIVWGAEDQFQPMHYGERLARAMQDARFESVAGAGHFLPEDAPETLASKIAGFARDTRGGSLPS